MKRNNILLAIGLVLMTVLSGCQGQSTVDEVVVIQTEQMDVVDVIMNTYSAREFTDEAVSTDNLEKILLSGAKAPSARNSQSWHFTVVKDKELAGKIANATTDGTVAIVISGLTVAEEGINVDFDCALAAENMYLAAQSLGLGAHIYTGPIRSINEEYYAELEIPEGYEGVALLVIGHVESQADAIAAASQRDNLSDMVNYIE